MVAVFLINIGRLGGVSFQVVAVLLIVLALWGIYFEAKKTVLTDEGVRFFDLKRFWRLRPVFVPWCDIGSVEVHVRRRSRHVGVRLMRGDTVILSTPNDLFDKPRFARDLATIQRWHAYCGRTPMAS